VQWVGLADNWRSPQVPLAAVRKAPADRALVG
jgi:hypothetical protein